MHLPEMDVIQFSPRTRDNAEKYARARGPSASDRTGIHEFLSTILRKAGNAHIMGAADDNKVIQQSCHHLLDSLMADIHPPRLDGWCQTHRVGAGLNPCQKTSAIIAASAKFSDPITEITSRKVEPENRSQYHAFAHAITQSHKSDSGQEKRSPIKRGESLYVDLCLNYKQHSDPDSDSMFGDIVDFTTHKTATQRE